MTAGQPPELPAETQQLASSIAMVVRNALEVFHCQHLNDEQMRVLNPIIRNAICTPSTTTSWQQQQQVSSISTSPSVPIIGETTASLVITVEGQEVERWRVQGCW